MRKILMLLLVSALSLTSINAQKYTNTSHLIVINGTSNIHDWKIKVTKLTSVLDVKDSKYTLFMEMPAKFLKNDKDSKIMDNKTHEALKANKNPTINCTAVGLNSKDDTVLFTGILTVAGESKAISLKTKLIPTKNGYKLTGTIPLKMTDFKINPPKAMLGAMTTGNDITIKFDITFIN